MVTGTCGSGQTADCNDYHTEMYCCNMSASSNCGWVAGMDGDLVACTNGQSVQKKSVPNVTVSDENLPFECV